MRETLTREGLETGAPPGLGRRIFLSSLLSGVLGLILLIYLLIAADINLAAVTLLISGLRFDALVEITLLLGFNSFLAAEKWRLIDCHLGGSDGRGGMSRLLYFAFTSIGVALGQIVPAQLSLVMTRSIGAHLHGGRPLVRGATATVFDYLFDLLVAACVGVASLLVLAFGGGGLTWGASALTIGAGGFLLYGPAVRHGTGAARLLGIRGRGRFGRFCTTIATSSLLKPAIGRRLLALSVLRFGVLTLITGISARAITVEIPFWQLAASIPFATLANAMALTPGGLGVNEWTLSSALAAFGTPFEIAAQWAFVNRVLVTAAAVPGGILGLLIAVVARSSRHGRDV